MAEKTEETPDTGASKEDKKNDPVKKIRFDWLDEFRGLVILLFIIQTVAWATVNKLNYPVIAPHLNHGYKYYQVEGWPPIVTLIDAGQQIFIFLVGYMAAFSVMKMRRYNKPDKDIWKRVFRRLIAILLLNVLHLAGSGDLEPEKIAFHSTLGMIAWAGFAAALVTIFVEDPDKRLMIGGVFFVLHFILDLSTPITNAYLELISHIGIGIVATAYTGWMLKGDGTINEEYFKNRVLPVTFWSFAVMYLVEFFQPADHHGATVPIAMIAIGVSGMAIYLFYRMDKDGYRIKFLIPFGRNLLLVFILEMVVVELIYMDMFMLDFLAAHPAAWAYFIFAGIIPILIMYVIAYILMKLGWTIRV